jgi:hypothetical protein
LTTAARTVAIVGAGFAAFSVVGVVTIAFRVIRELCLVDRVEAVVAVCDGSTLGSEVATDGFFTTSLLVASMPPLVAVEEEAGELAIAVGREDDRPLLGFGFAVVPVVLSALCVGSGVSASDGG